MYLTHITLNFTVNIIIYKIILFVRRKCGYHKHLYIGLNCACGATKHDSREYSTLYVTERGFPTFKNAAMCTFIL